MPRYTRNSAILAKIETTIGTDAAPTGSANALLVSNQNINPLNAKNVSRNLVRPYFGGSEQLLGSASVELSFDVEYQSSGSMVTPTIPGWDVLLQACGFHAGAGTAGARVEFDLESDYTTLKTATIYYYDDGVLHKLLGARGTVSLKLNVGDKPAFSFKFTGTDGGVTAVANPSTTLTGFKTPLVVTDPNTGALTFGGTYATGAITGGTEYVSGGLELDLANAVNFTDLLGTASLPGQSVDITGREGVGKIKVDLTAAQEVSFMASVKANSTQSIGLIHGTTAGYKMLVFCPSVQLTNPRKEDVNGRRLIGFDLRVMPLTGNDEIKIVAL